MRNLILLSLFFVLIDQVTLLTLKDNQTESIEALGATSGGPTGYTTGRPTGYTTGRPTGYTTRYTTRPAIVYCYSCTMNTCPLPFKGWGVRSDVSPNGWCLRTSMSPDVNALTERTIDQTNYCYNTGYGCRWNGIYYRCCCRGNLCNSSNNNFNFNYLILLFSLLFIFIKN